MNSNKEKRLYDALRVLMKENDKIKTKLKSYHEPIAIVGTACRFPSANSVTEFWQSLISGVDSAVKIPSSRWDHSEYYDQQRSKAGKIYTTHANFIDDYERFDADFFSITPKEAANIDPQHRLMIELTHKAFENALLPMNCYRNTAVGVFIGHFTHDYANMICKLAKDEELSAYTALGNSASTIAGRLSYIYGFEGPSFPVNTACSSSLVAADLACKSLQNQECKLAIVGGVNLMLAPETMINISQAQMLSDDGRCHTFDKDANGYGRGEGAGVILLKRLQDAINDQDNIEAVIIASGTNQDGASSALSVPNGKSQKKLLTQVLKSSGLKAADVDYIEAHGTGTSIGDPIEINAINEVYGGSHYKSSPLYVSSVKANIGHLEAAAGVAGLIKLTKCLQNKTIPPHINMKNLNPAIDLDTVPLEIPSKLTKLSSDKEAVAAISSFGFSGSNAHIILKEAPLSYKKSSGILRDVFLFKICAKSTKTLKKLLEKIAVFFTTNSNLNLANFSYSMNIGRDDYDYRVLISASSIEEAHQKIQQAINLEYDKKIKKIQFNCTSEIRNLMVYEPLLNNPTFREIANTCLKKINEINNLNLSINFNYRELDTIQFNNMCFCFYYSLLSYYLELGIKPYFVRANSMTYLPVLALANIMSLEKCIELYNDNHNVIPNIEFYSGDFLVYFELSSNDHADELYQYILEKVSVQSLNTSDLITVDLNIVSTSDLLINLNNHISEVFLNGGQIDWPLYETGFEQEKIQLVNYPFDKKSYILPYLRRAQEVHINDSVPFPAMFDTVYHLQNTNNNNIDVNYDSCLIITSDKELEKLFRFKIKSKINVIQTSKSLLLNKSFF